MYTDIEDYLTDNDIKNILQKEIKEYLYAKEGCTLGDKGDSNIERVISNSAYAIVYKMVDDCMDEKLENILHKKVCAIIADLGEFNIFKKPDVWDAEPNNAWKFLDKCLTEQFPRIKEIVAENIEAHTIAELKADLCDYIERAVKDIFINGGK